ncbi:MAG TPA: hypothetical protein G4O16_08585 [Dehalococcoidia bacterium]|nr:hypothetical protein [Dehalococcoidia bacterium]
MKKIIFIMLIVAALSLCIAAPAFASGDKVRGEKGQGEVNQVQIQDPPPFN